MLRVGVARKASSVYSRGVERSDTSGIMTPSLNVSGGIINFAS